MKKNLFFKLVGMALLVCTMLLLFASCDEWVTDVPGDKLLVADRQKLRFAIVFSEALKVEERKEAEAFGEALEARGFDTGDVIVDTDNENISDFEIVFGIDIKGRGEECTVDPHVIGEEGYIIKIVSTQRADSDEQREINDDVNTPESSYRIVVAAGSAEKYKTAVDVLLSEGLGLTEENDGEALYELYIDKDFSRIEKTKTDIENITVGDVSLSQYVFKYSKNSTLEKIARKLQSTIYEKAGIYVRREDELKEGEAADFKFTLRLSDNFTGTGFSVEERKNELIMTCASEGRFEAAVQQFIEDKILNATSKTVDLSGEYEWDISYKYSDFGAKGDGVTDDFPALKNTHEKANQDGVPVKADKGKTYYIGASSYGQAIPVKTDTYLYDAIIICDDSNLKPFNKREYTRNVYEILPSDDCKMWSFKEIDFTEMGLVKKSFTSNTVSESLRLNHIYRKSDDSIIFKAGQKNIGLTFDSKVMLILYNEDEPVYRRFGQNASPGHAKSEVIIVEKNGNVDSSTPLIWDYYAINAIDVYPVEEDSITFSGGTYRTIANKVIEIDDTATQMPNGVLKGDHYYYYGRGIYVARSNTVVSGVTHEIEGENTDYIDGKITQNNGGYPYRGWLDTSYCNNVVLDGITFQGHIWYQEDRDKNGDGIIQEGEIDSGSNMGTYDINAMYANKITWKNCKQTNSISASRFWGVMGANFVKNITYDGCTLSRFDTHMGSYNASILNSEIGLAINIVGKGTLRIENSTRKVGTSLITLRDDYGSTWDGDVIIRNAHLTGLTQAGGNGSNVKNKTIGIFSGTYTPHNFGYKCYMPQNIIIDNFTWDSDAGATSVSLFYYTDKTYTDSNSQTVDRKLEHESFTNATSPYQATKTITVKNQTKSILLWEYNANSSRSHANKGVFGTLMPRIDDPDGKLTLNDAVPPTT